MAFDLSTLAASETFELQLRHPVTDELLYDGEAAPENAVAIELYSTGAPEYQNFMTAMQNRRLKRGNKPVTAEVLREESVELLVACSVSARNLQHQGADLNSPAAFRKLYADPKMAWVKKQVDEAIGDTANFIQG